ncbi:MAG: hypothetical protein KKB30_01590 [Proteobacteria bacterium]|nr:hypothetical protein [Pseudomonadota bacterium]MBU1714310.1 hypothetical protein [Pseudomonadota bacterium]
MFPLKDNIPARNLPVVTLWLIIINTLCFIYESKLGAKIDFFLNDYGFIPARYLAQQAENFLDLSRFVPVITFIFLHGGVAWWAHIGGFACGRLSVQMYKAELSR